MKSVERCQSAVRELLSAAPARRRVHRLAPAGQLAAAELPVQLDAFCPRARPWMLRELPPRLPQRK